MVHLAAPGQIETPPHRTRRDSAAVMAFATRNIKYRAGRELEIASPMASCGVPETNTTPHHPDGQLDEDAPRHVCAVEAAPVAGNPQSSA